jgi:hypothetical protein
MKSKTTGPIVGSVKSRRSSNEIGATFLRLLTVDQLTMTDEATYTCDSCGEEIVFPIDVSAGAVQEYVEDCPVCCRPNIIHVDIDEYGEARVWASKE